LSIRSITVHLKHINKIVFTNDVAKHGFGNPLSKIISKGAQNLLFWKTSLENSGFEEKEFEKVCTPWF
jgi:hypothetical protein